MTNRADDPPRLVIRHGISAMKGITYFRRWGFSINESEFPNIHMSWRNHRFNFYLALSRRLKLYFGFPLPI